MDCVKIKHQLPGRVRFYVPAIRRNKLLSKDLYTSLKVLQQSVLYCHVNPSTGSVLLYYHPDKITVKQLADSIGFQLNNLYLEKDVAAASTEAVAVLNIKKAGSKRNHDPEDLPIPVQIAQVTISGVVLLALAVKQLLGKSGAAHAGSKLNIASVTTAVSAYPIVKSGVSGLINEKELNNDLLISVATGVALLMGEGLTALVVVWLVNLSTLLQSYTLDRTRRAIGDLLDNKNEQAWLLVDGTQVSVPVENLKPGDVVVVYQGGKIPVDGKVCSGSAAVNQAPITGESMPVYKQIGEEVYAGTIVDQGSIQITAEKVGDKTALSRIIHMVEEASNKKAPIQNIADRYTNKIVPMSLLLASLVFLFTRDIYRTMTILIVACPCAAGLSTPTAISAAMGNAASRGILIKGGCYLETAGKVDTVLFDKTGTLTEGRPEVSSYVSLDDKYTPEQILALAAAGEKYTNHPLAVAVVNKALEVQQEIPECDNKEIIVGMGIKGTVNNELVLIGNHRLMQQENVAKASDWQLVKQMSNLGESIIYVAQQDKLIGLISVRDRLRSQSKRAVKNLKSTGVKNIGMISGDNTHCANAVGQRLNIDEVWSNMMPEDKVKVVQEMQRRGKVVAMVGEGINDSPALAVADIGIAMGVKGTDVAVESADVVLAGDDPVKVAQLVQLSRRTMKTIHQNFAFAIGANALGITLGTLRIISPFTAAILHNASTLAVVLNSARLVGYQRNEEEKIPS